LQDPSEQAFKKTVNLLTAANVLWVSGQQELELRRNPTKGIFMGMARVARAEVGSASIQYIDVQDTISTVNDNLIDNIVSIVLATEHDEAYISRSIEPEYIYRDGELLIPRLIPSTSFSHFAVNSEEHMEEVLYRDANRPVKLHIETPGLLDSMIFVEDPTATQPLGEEEIEIETRAFGINFKDVYIALGQMRHTDTMVGEISGVVTRAGSAVGSSFQVGQKVFAWHSAPFASHARIHISRAGPLPEGLTFAEGASMPVVFMTAYYALLEKANLQKGQSVLIHAGSGGVGQAAIQIAQHIGAEIFTTVGSAAKKQFIKDTYNIPESHIFSSKLRNFKAGVLRLTGGHGVDVVLNSLAGEALLDSWACVASLGTFVEIGKSDIYQNMHLGMSQLAKSITLVSFDLAFITENRPAITQNTLRQVAKLVADGAIKPVQPITTMPISSIEDAFRLIQGRRHTGKVVLEADSDTLVRSRIQQAPTNFGLESTFVIAGGLGDVGKEMCRFFASHGAQHVVTLSRRTLDPKLYRSTSEELAKFGAKFHALRCDVTVSLTSHSSICVLSTRRIKHMYSRPASTVLHCLPSRL
jgi:NADPH:quinone reductase-like Zn-dependent oxidoreductase